MKIEDIKNNYILNKTQLIILDESGQILQSDNHLFKLPISIAITEIHPFFETIQVLLNQANESITFNCVHLSYKSKEGIYDLILKSENSQNYLILYDFTDHYNFFQSIAQERNHSILNFYYEKLKTEQLSNEKAFKQKFLSQLTTDLKTPLETALSLQELLYQSARDNYQKNITQEIKDYLQTIYQKVENIYDLVKIEQGLLEANNSTFYLLKIIDKLKKKYTKIAVKKQLEFDVILDNNLPHYLNGDTQKLLQILESFIDNAFKFTQKGAVKIQINEAYKRANQIWLSFEIEDTGQALNNQILINNINNNLAVNDNNLGLGFSLIKKLLPILNATIKYKINNNGGCTFVLNIPLQIDVVKTLKKEKTFEKINFKDRISVLCLDDQEINHLVFIKMLVSHGGVYVDTSSNHQEALRFLEKNKYNIILINADMAQFDPTNFYEVIKSKLKRKAPAFVWISQTLETNNKAAFKYVINRPFTAEELYKKIYQSLKLI